jgi:hypothetical protein
MIPGSPGPALQFFGVETITWKEKQAHCLSTVLSSKPHNIVSQQRQATTCYYGGGGEGTKVGFSHIIL